MARRFDASSMIRELCDKPKHARITELEFTIFMLKSMNKVDERVLAAIHHQFASLDKAGSGVLDFKALKEFERQSYAGRKSMVWASTPMSGGTAASEVVPKSKDNEGESMC